MLHASINLPNPFSHSNLPAAITRLDVQSQYCVTDMVEKLGMTSTRLARFHSSLSPSVNVTMASAFRSTILKYNNLQSC